MCLCALLVLVDGGALERGPVREQESLLLGTGGHAQLSLTLSLALPFLHFIHFVHSSQPSPPSFLSNISHLQTARTCFSPCTLAGVHGPSVRPVPHSLPKLQANTLFEGFARHANHCDPPFSLEPLLYDDFVAFSPSLCYHSSSFSPFVWLSRVPVVHFS